VHFYSCKFERFCLFHHSRQITFRSSFTKPVTHDQMSAFDSRRYRSFWVVGLERGPLSLVSTTEELLGRKSSCSGLENREYGHRDPSHWPRSTLYPYKLTLTSPTSGDRSVGIVRSRTQATEFLYTHTHIFLLIYIHGEDGCFVVRQHAIAIYLSQIRKTG
jgi:hypothetical protein